MAHNFPHQFSLAGRWVWCSLEKYFGNISPPRFLDISGASDTAHSSLDFPAPTSPLTLLS